MHLIEFAEAFNNSTDRSISRNVFIVKRAQESVGRPRQSLLFVLFPKPQALPGGAKERCNVLLHDFISIRKNLNGGNLHQ